MVNIGYLASGIYTDELESDPTTSIAAVSGWLTYNVGSLNNLLNTNYSGISGQIDPPLGSDEVAIYKELFLVKYYQRRVSSNLGAASYDSSVVEVSEERRRIKVISRNDIAKVFLGLKKEAQDTLERMVAMYRMNRANPVQVAGQDEDVVIGMNPYLNEGNLYRSYYDLD